MASEVGEEIREREIKKDVAWSVTLFTCGISLPVTLPYVGYQKRK